VRGAASDATPRVLRIGIPAGRFVDHGSVADLRRVLRLDEAGIQAQVEEAIATLGIGPSTDPRTALGVTSGPSPRVREAAVEARPA
jgi:hypothetical protein